MNLGLFDGTWLLRRNACAMKNSGPINYKDLVRSFFSSLAKLSSEFGVTNPCVVFDAWPYKRSEYVSLKTSRYYPNEADIQTVPETATEEEKAKIEAANAQLRANIADEQQFHHAKNFIVKYSRELGIPALRYDGLEADDISFYVSNKLGIKHDIYLIALDSDWMFALGPTGSFYRCNKARDKRLKGKQNLFPEGIPLIYYGCLSMMYHNHNDIMTMDLGMSLEDACHAFKEDQLEFYLGEKAAQYKTLMKALDPNTFFNDDIKNYLLKELEIDPAYYDDISVREFGARHGIYLNYKTVGPMLKARDRSCTLLQEVVTEFPKEVINE